MTNSQGTPATAPARLDSIQSPSSAQRNLRLDFVRGMALCIVLVDHIEDQLGVYVLRNWTFGAWGFSDAADVFVFLSGFVFCIAYEKRLARSGLVSCQRRALWRSFEIYLTYQVTIWVVLIAGVLSVETCPSIAHSLEVKENIPQCLAEALRLRYQPYPFAILTVYTLILPFMPALLWLLKNARHLAWLLSLGVYLSAQFIPNLALTIFPGGREADFNPFAWQFLFFLGMACQCCSNRRRLFRPALTAAAILIAAWGMIEVKFGVRLHEYTDLLPQAMSEWCQVGRPWTGKVRLESVRIVHFLSLVYLATIAMHHIHAFWQSGFARLFIFWGQYSLETYAFGIVLTTVSNMVPCLFGRPSTATAFFVDLDACLLSIMFASCLAGLKRRRNRA